MISQRDDFKLLCGSGFRFKLAEGIIAYHVSTIRFMIIRSREMILAIDGEGHSIILRMMHDGVRRGAALMLHDLLKACLRPAAHYRGGDLLAERREAQDADQ